ncbi:MAG: exo-alpha-sialidase [Bacteroidales bacterium]|nr:exo-alpha-sialidase [Bacteroidales bacterium]
MKKIVLFSIAACVFAACCSTPQDGGVRVSWDGSTFQELTSFEVEGRDLEENNLYYPRIRTLSDGSMLMCFMNHKFGWDIYVTKSYDEGKTWGPAKLVRESEWVDSPFGRDIRASVNPDFLELSDGRIIMAFQTRYLDHYHDFSVTNDACWIEVVYSEDKGETWSEPREVFRGRCWEPSFLELPSGELQMYITDSGVIVDNDHTLTTTSIIRSFDGGLTWQGKELTRWEDLEPIAALVLRDRRIDGMPSAVQLKNGDIICPLEQFSHSFPADPTPIVVRTSASQNWKGDRDKILNEGGPDYPLKRQLNKDFYGYAPYCCILPGGEPLVASNGKYRNVSGFWIFTGDKLGEVYSHATSPFNGFWGNIAYIGGGKVIASATVETKKDATIRDTRTTISPNTSGWHNPADNILGNIRICTGYLNFPKEIKKGDVNMTPLKDFTPCGQWFLGKAKKGSLWSDFAYTAENFIFTSWLFDTKLCAYPGENGDAPVILIDRGRKGTYKISVTAVGFIRVCRLEYNAWRIIYEAEDAEVELDGTLNDHRDEDLGFSAKVSVPWSVLGGKPRCGEVLHAHLRHNYKDGSSEKPMCEYEDLEGENSDYPLEWLTITLKP